MTSSQKGIATILGLFLIVLMIGAMAVGIELVRKPTSFPSKASDIVNAVNVFQEAPSPSPATIQKPPPPTPAPSPKTEKPSKFVVAVQKGPYLVQKQQCFDILASHTKFEGESVTCTPLAGKVAFDNDLFPEIPKTLTNVDSEGDGCFYTGTFCKSLPPGDHIFRVIVVSSIANEESGEFSLHYTYTPKAESTRRSR